MAWLKLTRKALYLMQTGGSKYIDKVDLEPHNLERDEFKLTIPHHWFQGDNAPGRMAIEVDKSHPEPLPAEIAPAQRVSVLDAYRRVIPARDWGARPRGPFRQTTPKYIVIHHTAHKANPNPPDDDSQRTEAGAKRLAQRFQNSHIDNNKWQDSGHNFLNSTGGFLLEGRQGSLEAAIQGRAVESAHAAQDRGKLAGGNASPGIENEGNFMTFPMGQVQWNSLIDLCAALCQSCKIDPNDIRGHRDFSATACPGDWLYNQLPALRQAVRQRLDQNP